MKRQPLFLASMIAGSLFLGGCLSELGLEEDNDDDSRPAGTLAGKAADGYLASANVCLDLNDNGVCDRGEPSATTGPDGDFTINADESQIAGASIVVEIIAGTTVDKDDGQVITKAYSLSAPAGYSFVSPISTLVKAKVKELGSVEEAEAALQASLGTTLDFNDDYIAGQSDALTSSEAKAAFAELHKVARVVATIIGNNLSENQRDQDDADFGEVMRLVVAKVDVAISQIATAVRNNTSSTFDPNDIATSSDIANATKVDPATLTEELALQETVNNATKADFQALLATNQGLHWLEYDYHFENSTLEVEIGYGVTTFDGTTTLNKFFAWDGSAFVQHTEEDDSESNNQDPMDCGPNQNEACDEEDNELVLTAAGWTEPAEEENDDEGPTFSSFGSDGSVLMNQGPFTFKLQGEEFPLNGKKIQGSLLGTGDWEWGKSVSATATFGEGAKGYKIKMSTSEDVYILPDFSEGCDDVADAATIVGDCNLVEFFAGDGEPDYQASTFNPIVTTRGTGSDPSTYTALALDGGDADESGAGFALLAEFGPNNTIFYYEVTLQNDQVTAITKVLEAPYEQKTVHGKSLIVFNVPYQLVPDFFDRDDDHHEGGDGSTAEHMDGPEADDRRDEDRGPRPNAIFLTAHEGYWRFGALLKAGTPVPDDAPFVYNKTAMDNIKSAFGTGANLYEPEPEVEMGEFQ